MSQRLSQLNANKKLKRTLKSAPLSLALCDQTSMKKNLNIVLIFYILFCSWIAEASCMLPVKEGIVTFEEITTDIPALVHIKAVYPPRIGEWEFDRVHFSYHEINGRHKIVADLASNGPGEKLFSKLLVNREKIEFLIISVRYSRSQDACVSVADFIGSENYGN